MAIQQLDRSPIIIPDTKVKLAALAEAPAPAPVVDATPAIPADIAARAWRGFAGETPKLSLVGPAPSPYSEAPAALPKANVVPRSWTPAPTTEAVESGKASVKRGHQDGTKENLVGEIQTLLNSQGADLDLDGKFGPKTEAALKKLTGKTTVDATTLEELRAKYQGTTLSQIEGWEKLTGGQQKMLQGAYDAKGGSASDRIHFAGDIMSLVSSSKFQALSPALREEAVKGLAAHSGSVERRSDILSLVDSKGFGKLDAADQAKLLGATTGSESRLQVQVGHLLELKDFRKLDAAGQAAELHLLATAGYYNSGVPAPKRR